MLSLILSNHVSCHVVTADGGKLRTMLELVESGQTILAQIKTISLPPKKKFNPPKLDVMDEWTRGK